LIQMHYKSARKTAPPASRFSTPFLLITMAAPHEKAAQKAKNIPLIILMFPFHIKRFVFKPSWLKWISLPNTQG
ncbi:hypothetical protein V3G70_28105, partial [Escherichia coli]|uniref:hypothetical protein n=1 Tax=Escherichia coli TaxID=562 RepID=UPI0035939701